MVISGDAEVNNGDLNWSIIASYGEDRGPIHSTTSMFSLVGPWQLQRLWRHTEPPQQLHTEPPQQLHTEPPQQLHTEPPQQLHTEPPQQLHTEPPQQLHTEPSQQTEQHQQTQTQQYNSHSQHKQCRRDLWKESTVHWEGPDCQEVTLCNCVELHLPLPPTCDLPPPTTTPRLPPPTPSLNRLHPPPSTLTASKTLPKLSPPTAHHSAQGVGFRPASPTVRRGRFIVTELQVVTEASDAVGKVSSDSTGCLSVPETRQETPAAMVVACLDQQGKCLGKCEDILSHSQHAEWCRCKTPDSSLTAAAPGNTSAAPCNPAATPCNAAATTCDTTATTCNSSGGDIERQASKQNLMQHNEFTQRQQDGAVLQSVEGVRRWTDSSGQRADTTTRLKVDAARLGEFVATSPTVQRGRFQVTQLEPLTSDADESDDEFSQSPPSHLGSQCEKSEGGTQLATDVHQHGNSDTKHLRGILVLKQSTAGDAGGHQDLPVVLVTPPREAAARVVGVGGDTTTGNVQTASQPYPSVADGEMEALLSPSSTEMPRKKSVRFSVPVQKATSSVSLNNMEHQKATQKQEEAEDGDVEDPHLAPTTSSASFTRKVGDDDEPSWSRVLLHYGDDLNFAHCSIRSCRPQWLQVVARREVFLLLYCLLGVTYGMSHTFTVSVISTIEKSFHLSSKQTGVILAGSWAVQAAVSTLLLLHGQSVHRGRWMVIGVVAGVASCLLAVVPQVVYGSGEVTREAFGEIERTETCFSEVTDENEESCKVFYEEFFVGPVIMLFISQFFIGIAISIFYSIGASYLDDINNHSPQYFGITLLLRVVGPVCGFLLGGSCVRVWISPSHDAPNLARNDPRWLGSWWIGFLFLGCCVLVLGGLLLLFLHNLTLKKGMVREGKRREASRSHWKVSNFNIFTTMRKEATLSIHDLPKTLKRLFTNKIWVGNLFSSVAFFLAFACYINFKSKYLEAEFRKSASEANFYTGLVTLVGSLLGIAVSTALVRWAPQGPRSLAACDTLLSALVFASFLGLMFIGCPRLQVVGPREKSAEGACSAKCGCSDRFSPLCLVQNHTILFYSACFAGCLTVDASTEPLVYRNCSCISHVTSSSTQPGLPDTDDLKNIVLNTTATSGYCPEPCENFAYYLVMQVLTNAVYTTGRLAVGIGHLRGVSERDKEVSLAILAVLVTVFGILPAPIIMGAAIDWSCSVWGTQCGGTGHCWLYDTHTLRLLVHLIPAVFTFISLIGDLVVFFCSHQLDVYDKRERRRRRVGEARVHVQGGRGVQV